MKLNAIGLTTACSLLCVAVCQPVAARTIRADQGQNGWVNPASPYTSSPYNLNPGVITPYAVSIGNSSALVDDTGLSGTSAVEYNWYASNTTFAQALNQAPALDQIVVYTLGGGSDSVSKGSQIVDLSGDTEIEFNYALLQSQLNQNPGATAHFTIGATTYSAQVANIYMPTSLNDFVFSSTGAFVGTLVTTTDGSGNPVTGLSSSLGGWTSSGGAAAAPEIDPSSILTALTVLAGTLVVVRGQTRSRVRVLANA